MASIQTHYRTCNICEAMCGLQIQYRDKEIISIRGDKEDVLSYGHICPKAVALQDFYTDKDRLKQPVMRTDQGWVTLEWEEALDEVAQRFLYIQNKYGTDAVGTYLGNPNAHKLGNSFFLPGLLRALKTRNRYSASSVDQLPHHFAANYMFGHGSLLPVPDIDHTDYMIIIGGNPIISNGSMMTCPNFGKRMKAIQDRGGNIVVIDPRRTETAEKADLHIFITPGTDAYLLFAMIHLVFANEWVTLRHLSDHIDGLEMVRSAAQNFSPDVVSDICGISPEQIYALTQAFTVAPSAVCYSRMGASTQQFGGLCLWLTNVLNIITGNMDRSGGAMFTQPAYDIVALTSKKGRPSSYGKYHSRVKGLPYINSEYPVSTLADEILTPGEGQIKGMVTVAGNPLLTCPNSSKLKKAFESLDFYVAIDPYINETTRHADIILPGTVALEESQYDIAFHNLAVRNTVKYAEPLFVKQDNQRHDWEILNRLSARLKGEKPTPITPLQMLEMGLLSGTYKDQNLSLAKLIQHPHGIDLGSLKPCLLTRLQTQNDKINLAPNPLIQDIDRLRSHLLRHHKLSPDYPFRLIGRRLLRSHNTWCHNSYRLIKGRNECTLLIHPDDASKYNIENGKMVNVISRVGQINIEAQITDAMMTGVISIPQGWGHHDKESQLSVAQTNPGINMNELSDDDQMDHLTGNAVLNGIPVQIALA